MKRITTIVLFLAACTGGDVENANDGVLSAVGNGDTGVASVPEVAVAAETCPAATAIPSTAPELSLIGDPGSALGIFDPSVVYPAGAPGGAMAYSAVPTQHSISTRIALSNNGGATWFYVAQANAPELALIPSSDAGECPGGWCFGWLISEVPSLIFDPTDPNVNARWKLYAHRYLVEANDRLHYALGTITVQSARDPQGPWTPPRKLFGVPSSSSYTLAGTQVDVSKFAMMSDCLALTEPSALWLPDRIDVAMGCIYWTGTTAKIRVAMVRSTNHGATWSPVARLLEAGDADCLPGTSPGASVNAANLFIGPDGGEYLSASSSDPGYHGCAIYRIDNPLTGHIERTATGAPRVVRAMVSDTGPFSGACTWSAGGGGYLMPMGFFGQPRPFRIIRAGTVL
jgi:hypothetical protein